LSSGLLKPPAGVERVKRSVGLLKSLEEKGRSKGSYTNIIDLVLATLRDPVRILSLDDSKLLSEKLIHDAYHRTSEMVTRGTLDRSDYSLLLRAAQLLGLVTDTKSGLIGGGKIAGPFRHVVIDEVQDYSPVELATVLSTLTAEGSLTLVGDVSQRTEDGFPGWKKLQGWWAERKRESSFVKLEVSHRCTKEIMRCAALLGDSSATPSQVVVSGRNGHKPRWLMGEDQEQSLAGLLDWLTERTEEAPNALLAVVCFSQSAARDLRSLLEPKFGASVRMIEDGDVSFEQGILIGEASSLKGLEFYGVVLWEPTNKTLPPGEIGANLLYVACTRAQEHLAFVTSSRNGTPLNRLSNSILQRVEVEPLDRTEEDENPFSALSYVSDEEKAGGSRRSNREE
jgi:superfamily I DNA/RNA helicase